MVCCICVMSLVLELLEGVGSFLLICEKWLFYCSMAHILHFQMDLRCFLFPQKLLFCDNSLHLQSGINNFSFYSFAGLWCVLARYLWDGEDVPSQSFSVSHIPSQGAQSHPAQTICWTIQRQGRFWRSSVAINEHMGLKNNFSYGNCIT